MPKRIASRPRNRTTHQCSDIVRTAEKIAMVPPSFYAEAALRKLLLLLGRLDFALALPLQVGAVGALVGLNVLETPRLVANGVELLPGDASMGRAFGHRASL